MDGEQLVQGALAKVQAEMASADAYATSGTPSLATLELAEVVLSDEEVDAIVAQVRAAIKTDAGNKALFEGAVGLVGNLLKKGLAFVLKA